MLCKSSRINALPILREARFDRKSCRQRYKVGNYFYRLKGWASARTRRD